MTDATDATDATDGSKRPEESSAAPSTKNPSRKSLAFCASKPSVVLRLSINLLNRTLSSGPSPAASLPFDPRTANEADDPCKALSVPGCRKGREGKVVERMVVERNGGPAEAGDPSCDRRRPSASPAVL